MRIQHNIMAMSAYRNYNTNTSALAKNLEKLSSGYKINRAGDDAAGLAISEKMRAQITGLNAAQKNVKDGISLVKTAEGAMQEIQDMLNRMDYLATQSANGTYDNEVDRAALQKEVNQLRTEIDRIADSANFNGIKLLDGSLTTKYVVDQVGSAAMAKNPAFDPELSNDGAEPTGATKAKYTVQLADLDTTKDADITDDTVNGGRLQKANNASAATYTSLNIAATGKGDDGVLKLTYVDADGATQNVDLELDLTGATAPPTTQEIVDQINAQLTTKGLNGLFTATVDNTNAVKFTSQSTGSAAPYVTGLEVKTAGDNAGLSLSGGAAKTVRGADEGTYDFSGWKASDTVKVNGKEYKYGTGSGEYATVDALLKAMVADGLAVTGNKDASGNFDGTNVTIKGKQVDAEIGSDATTKTITGGKSTIADLGNVKIAKDSANKDLTIKDLFKVTIDGTEVTDWTKDDKIAAGASIVFEAKMPGALPAAAAAAMKDIPGANVEVNVVGKDEDAAAEGTKAKYDITFNFAQLAGNQRLQIGNDIFEISTSGKLNDSSHTLIDLSGLDPTKDADKQKIADRIYAAIKEKLDAKFDSKAPTVAAGATKVTLSFEAKAAGKASDLGNVKVWDNPQAISASHTYGVDAAPDDGAKHAKLVYNIDLSKLIKGDKITLGTGSSAKTVEIVDDKDEDLAAGKVGVSNATNGSVLVDSFYRQGYDQILKIESNKITIEAAQQTNSGNSTNNNATNPTKITAKDFAAGAGKLSFQGGTSTTTKPEGGALQLQIGDTSDSWNQMKVSVGDMHVAAMFGLQRNTDGTLVKDSDGNTVNSTETIATIDITTADEAASAINVIRDAINYVSGVRGDLGAIQNRLEHTSNNLSVMAENIQDAESTIRDTDVAEEMMAYTKNNILIQSAQAMLAQANAIPQGVLQLLG